jgi:hypothetical protein
MINTIKLLIDNEKVLLDEFIEMAQSSINEYDLASSIESWFEDWLDTEHIKVEVTRRREYDRSLQFVYDSILRQAIANITQEEWVDVANHYLRKTQELEATNSVN